jgi:23S rRNA (uracil1939-C5)-methyltransferase
MIKIKKIVYEGYGLGYEIDNPDSPTYFVLNAFPDDIVKVNVLYKKKTSLFCEIAEIVTPSPYRGDTRCEVSNLCGACDWVIIDYIKQIELKSNIYQDIFGSGHIIEPSPVVDFYRNKCFFPVQKIDDTISVGMFERNTHKVIKHDNCYLYPSVFAEISKTIVDWMITAKAEPYDETTHTGLVRHIGIRCSSDMSEIQVILVTTKTKIPFSKMLVNSLLDKFSNIKSIVQNIQSARSNVIVGEKDKLLYGSYFISDKVGHLRLCVHYAAFLQINLAQAEKIYTKISEFVSSNNKVLDAYCGIGSIGLFIANKVKQVYLLDENTAAYQSQQKTIELNNLSNVVAGQGKSKLDGTLDYDVIIYDPPRKGLDRETILSFANSQHDKKIIYLSCNPSTQRRDIEIFNSIGYKVTYLQGFDMFPHTWHIESLAVLEKT